MTPKLRTPAPSRSNDAEEVEKLLQELIPERRGSGELKASGALSPSPRTSRPNSIFGTGKFAVDPGDRGSGSPSNISHTPTQSIATQTFSTIPIALNYEYAPSKTSVPTPPLTKEVLSFHKAIQTSEPWSVPSRDKPFSADSDSDSDRTFAKARTPKRPSRREREREEELRANLRQEIEEELKAVTKSDQHEPTSATNHNFPARTLTEEELDAVTSSIDFLEFIERSSKVIEKSLDQDYDILADYALDGVEGMEDDEDEGYGGSKGKKRRRIREVVQFYDERWSRKRMISDLGYSPKVGFMLSFYSGLANPSQFPELLLASYTKNPSAPQDPSGLVQIWNIHLHSRPEYIFHSTSDVLTAKFSPFHPSLIFGGCYSGQVVLWDTRAKSSLPVQKTPLAGVSAGGHAHPVYSISLVGTQNANNIISCSTDGVVCGWTVDMLTQPQEYLELSAPPPSKMEDISPTRMSFPSSDPTSFLVGTEEGGVYPCHRYDRAGAKAGVDPRMRYVGHSAPVTGLDFHPTRGPVDLGDLLLSSSFDWTVKLWKVRPLSSTIVASAQSSLAAHPSGATQQAIEAVKEFSREDTVYDVRWSPHRPGIFSLVDGAGSVEVWDLNIDTEVPLCRATPEINRKAAQGSVYLGKSLNKVVWEEKEARKLAVGGASGVVSVLEVSHELAGEGARGEEWTGVKRMVGRVEKTRRG